MIDLNEVILTGTASWFKVYPLNGKSFTSASLLVKYGNYSVFVDIPLDANKISSPSLKEIESAASSKSPVFMIGSLVERKNKDGNTTPSLRVSLGNIKVSTKDVPLNRVTCSGIFTKPIGESVYKLEVSYLNPKEGKYLKRNLPISKDSNKIINDYDNQYLWITGQLISTKEKGIIIDPTNVIPLASRTYGQKKRVDQVYSNEEFS